MSCIPRIAGLVLLAGSLGCAAIAPPTAEVDDASAVPIWDQPPPLARDAAVVDPERLHRAELPNGLQVIVLEDRRLPRFDAGIVVPRGAAIEHGEQAGIAALVTEAMERGAGERDALALAGVVDQLGASLSVGSGWDSTIASVGGLSRDRDVLLSVLADVVLRPRFDAPEVERARAEQLAGIERGADDPRTLASRAFADALYAGHRYGVPIEGSAASVAGLDRDDVVAFHAQVFRPSGAIFFASGDVDAAAILARVEADYGDWTGPEIAAPAPAPPAETARRVVVVDRPDLGQAQVLVGHEGIARSADTRLEVQLMNTVLGSAGFSSRLMGRIRAVEGLTYGIYSTFVQRRQPGPFLVSTSTRVEAVGQMLQSIHEELERMRTEPPSAEELAKVQSLRVGRFALGLESSGAVASALVDLDIHGLPRDSLDTYRGRVRALTPEATAAEAVARIHPERTTIVLVGPAEAIVPQLGPYGDVEVVTP